MDQRKLAIQLIDADEGAYEQRLRESAGPVNVELARALKQLYDESKFSDVGRAIRSAQLLTTLANGIDPVGGVATGGAQREIKALAAWTAGMAALQLDGKAEHALGHFDQAISLFEQSAQLPTAAAVQVSRLHALALLGRYDEAIAGGLWARAIVEQAGDLVTAGKIEQNLGGIYWRRGHYREAEALIRQARARYLQIGDQAQLAQIENVLGSVLALQHQFREAEALHSQALARAESIGLATTQAEIECNLGSLALFQGRYDRALDYLERSRRRYAQLNLPHESAIAEQELAEAYLELNLAPEASAIYARVIPLFTELGLRGEEARARLYAGRAYALLGQFTQAHDALSTAYILYTAEANPVGAAMTQVAQAQLFFAEQNFPATVAAAQQAEPALATAQVWSWLLWARWLRGEAARAQGHLREARRLFAAILRDARQQQLPQLIQRCYTALGLLALNRGDRARAESCFAQAIQLIEALRAPLPAEEFRMAFVSDKLTAYTELVRLCLQDGTPARVAQAFHYVEQARSRALVDLLAGELQTHPAPRDDFEQALLTQLETLRTELSWFYSQINHAGDAAQHPERSTATLSVLYAAVRTRETTIQEITRQLQQRSQALPPALGSRREVLDLAQLQQDLGDTTALVEYFSLDGALLAFVVTGQELKVVNLPGSEAAVGAALQQLQFQLGTLRHGADRLRARLPLLAERTRAHLQTLYDLLLRPIEGQLAGRRLLVAPYRALHYVPFPALHDGAGYVIERREVCYTPSASVLHHCLAAPRRPLQRAVLLGVPDAIAPRMRDEVTTLRALFPAAVTLLDEAATRQALLAAAPTADLLHLACHGRFRADNPLFSSLRLADEWFTVRDAYSLPLNCELVTLSACETGVSQVAPGDELMGLARGFFAAGAPSLLVSLWTVDDAATAQLMTYFYQALLTGIGPAAALRSAQCQLLQSAPHPYFWAPFILLGRW